MYYHRFPHANLKSPIIYSTEPHITYHSFYSLIITNPKYSHHSLHSPPRAKLPQTLSLIQRISITLLAASCPDSQYSSLSPSPSTHPVNSRLCRVLTRLSSSACQSTNPLTSVLSELCSPSLSSPILKSEFLCWQSLSKVFPKQS